MHIRLSVAVGLCLSLASGALVLSPAVVDAAPRIRYEVRVTNLTRGQIFSPAVAASHSPRLAPLFVVGEAASQELASVAEDAVLDPLVAKLSASADVADVGILADGGGPIPPGETGTLVIAGGPRATRFSLDGFYAINGGRLPAVGGRTSYVWAYDAGSEANSELCAFIPGPPCGNVGVRDTVGAEGFVHVHAGIHGIGDLDASQLDWRNPVALVTIRRLRGSE